MARKEFTKATQRKALKAADYRCVGERAPGIRCDEPIGNGRPVQFDHRIPDAMGGEPTLENCDPLCRVCHARKTVADQGDIARAKRLADKRDGITDPHRRPLVGRGFGKSPPQNTCRVPAKGDLPPLPRRSLFIPA